MFFCGTLIASGHKGSHCESKFGYCRSELGICTKFTPLGERACAAKEKNNVCGASCWFVGDCSI